MKHVQPGLSVLEVIITIMISAMLMTSALTIYNQISKGALTVQRITQTDTQVMILHNRLVADLQGLCPLWFTAELYEKLKKTAQGKDLKDVGMSAITGNSATKKRNNFLYAQSNDKQFDFLTFVSTNALQVYGDKQVRTVRIVYFLQPDQQIQGTFKLMRKEDDAISGDFDIEKLKTGHCYQIAHKITECSIEYGFIESENKKADTPSPNSDKPFEFKFVSKWGGAKESEKEEDKAPTLPDILKLTIKIAHTPDQDAKAYELFCTIPTSHASVIKSFAEQRQAEGKQAKNPEQGANPAQDLNAPPTAASNPSVAQSDGASEPKSLGAAITSGAIG